MEIIAISLALLVLCTFMVNSEEVHFDFQYDRPEGIEEGCELGTENQGWWTLKNAYWYGFPEVSGNVMVSKAYSHSCLYTEYCYYIDRSTTALYLTYRLDRDYSFYNGKTIFRITFEDADDGDLYYRYIYTSHGSWQTLNVNVYETFKIPLYRCYHIWIDTYSGAPTVLLRNFGLKDYPVYPTLPPTTTRATTTTTRPTTTTTRPTTTTTRPTTTTTQPTTTTTRPTTTTTRPTTTTPLTSTTRLTSTTTQTSTTVPPCSCCDSPAVNSINFSNNYQQSQDDAEAENTIITRTKREIPTPPPCNCCT